MCAALGARERLADDDGRGVAACRLPFLAMRGWGCRRPGPSPPDPRPALSVQSRHDRRAPGSRPHRPAAPTHGARPPAPGERAVQRRCLASRPGARGDGAHDAIRRLRVRPAGRWADFCPRGAAKTAARRNKSQESGNKLLVETRAPAAIVILFPASLDRALTERCVAARTTRRAVPRFRLSAASGAPTRCSPTPAERPSRGRSSDGKEVTARRRQVDSSVTLHSACGRESEALASNAAAGRRR